MTNFNFPLNLNSHPVVDFSYPHGFLIWRGKQVTVASDQCLPHQEPVFITSEGEAFGLATLGQPAQMTISEFEREVHSEKHKIRPEERKLLWPGAKALYIQEIKDFQPFDSPKPIVDGFILEDSYTPEEAAIIEKSKKLPKIITLHTAAVCLTDEGFMAIKEAQGKELADILGAVYEQPVSFNGAKGNIALPLYSLALVRPPAMRFDKILSRILSAEKAHSGAMVAFMLPEEYAKQLAISPEGLPDGWQVEPAEELHLTLAYLGKAADLEGQKETISGVLESLAEETPALTGQIGGFGRFLTNETDGTNAIYASFDAPELPAFRQKLVERLAGTGIQGANNHGFTPHITLCYLPANAPTPDLVVPTLEMTFPNLTLAWGGTYANFSLSGPEGQLLLKKKSVYEQEASMPHDKKQFLQERLDRIRGAFRARFGDDNEGYPWVIDASDNFIIVDEGGARYQAPFAENTTGEFDFPPRQEWLRVMVNYTPVKIIESEVASKQFDDSPWDGAASSWETAEAYCDDCLIDVNPGGEEKTKSLCKLPYRKPGATNPNINALRAIAGGRGITAVTKPEGIGSETWIGWWPEAFDKPASDSIYQVAGKEPPESGKEGRRLRSRMLDKLKEIIGGLQSLMGWAEYAEDEEIEPLTDMLKGNSGFAVKTVNGEPWHFSWSANSFQDRDKEFFSLDSIEQYVKENEKNEDKGWFNFWHIPETDFAAIKWQGIVGKFLVEAGPYLKDFKGQAALKFFGEFPDRHPEFAPEGWGSSVEYRYLPEERQTGVYKWFWKTRTSTLPKAAAANLWTESKQEIIMLAENEEQRKAAEAIFGKPFVDKLISEGKTKTQVLEEAGVANKGKQAGGSKASKLGAWLAAKREAMEMSVDDLAKAIETSAEVINAIESGQVFPGMDVLEMLAKALGSTTEELAGVMAEEFGMAAAVETEEAEIQVEAEEAKGTPPIDLDVLAQSLVGLMSFDVGPLAEAITNLTTDLKGITGRLDKLEGSINLKQKTDMPRYYFGVTRASEAAEAEVKETDPLKGKKPVEKSPVGPGRSMAGAYFPSAK